MLHYELELTTIKIKTFDSSDKNKEKALKWIFSHRQWLFSLSGIIYNVTEVTKEELEKWD